MTSLREESQSHKSQEQSNVVTTRKKRTFDIAFLTGQSEKYENNNNNNSSKEIKKNYYTSTIISPEGREMSPTSSTSSSMADIDVLTNGSLSENEEQIQIMKNNNSSQAQKITKNYQNNSRVLLSLSQSHHNYNNHLNKFPNLKKKLKTSQPQAKEESIRFESKLAIDINHSQDSLKIKENLHFSTLMNNPQNFGQEFIPPEFTLLPPHIQASLAFFPHTFSKFLPLHHHQMMHHVSHPGNNSSINNSNQGAPSQPDPLPLGIHFSSKSESSQNQSKNNSRQFQDIYPPPSPYPPYIIPPQYPSPPSASNSSPTLLPPSLTALTLPAQNVCAKCSIGFRMTSDLVYHMRSHHKRDTFDPLKKQREEKLKCPVCHETFRERHHLTRHMTAHQDRKEEVGIPEGSVSITKID